MKGLLTTYLGSGLLVDRPNPPDIIEGTLAIYRDETGIIYAWDPIELVWDTFGLAEAPKDGTAYMRMDGAWVEYVPPVIPPAPDVPVQEAPEDGESYMRKDGNWSKYVAPAAPVIPVQEAPEDGKQYARKDGAWSEVESSGGGDASFPPLVGNGGKALKVKADESGVEWAEDQQGGGGGGGSDPEPWLVRPTASQFQLFSGDSTQLTLVDKPGYGLTWDGGPNPVTDILRTGMMVIPNPNRSWLCEMQMIHPLIVANYRAYGMIAWDEAGSRAIRYQIDETRQHRISLWNGLSSYVNNLNQYPVDVPPGFFRIDYDADGDRFYMQTSVDGMVWVDVANFSRPSNLPNRPTKLGFFVHNSAPDGLRMKGSLKHFKFTPL